MALPFCEGGERRGQVGSSPGEHDVCARCGGRYRVKLNGTLIKHRPHHKPGAPTTPRPDHGG